MNIRKNFYWEGGHTLEQVAQRGWGLLSLGIFTIHLHTALHNPFKLTVLCAVDVRLD